MIKAIRDIGKYVLKAKDFAMRLITPLTHREGSGESLFDRLPIKRMDWYIINKFIGTYVYSIILIISVSIVFDVNENLAKFATNNAPLRAIVFDYYANFVPYFANLFSPLFVFIAVIFFTSKLAGNSEIIAMLASGMSFKRLQ